MKIFPTQSQEPIPYIWPWETHSGPSLCLVTLLVSKIVHLVDQRIELWLPGTEGKGKWGVTTHCVPQKKVDKSGCEITEYC